MLNRLRLPVFTALFAAVLTACAGEGVSGPDSGPAITVVPGTASVRGGAIFSVTVRGAVASDSVDVSIASASAWASRATDTTLNVMMPGGPDGSVTLQVRVRNASGLRTATATLSRIASVPVSNPDAYIDSVRAELAATAGDVEALTPPNDASATAFGNDVALAKLWADSASTLLAALSPTDRAAAAVLIANLESQAAAEAGLHSLGSALRDFDAAALAIDCYSDRIEAATCLAGLLIALRGDIAKLVAGGLVASAGYALLQTPGAQLLGAAVGVLGAAKIGLTLASMYEKTEKVVFGPAIFRTLALGGPQSLSASTMAVANSVASMTLNPDAPVALPLTLTTTNPLTSDGERSPLVAELLPIFERVAEIRQQVMDFTADLIELPAASLPDAVVRSLQSPLGTADVEVVEVSDPSLTVTIEDVAGSPVLRVTGDAGEGKDLTVWIEADGGDAGWAELELGIRYEEANPCPATVTDIDGNSYATVRIGEQCWMRENLRVGRLSDGTAIANPQSYMDWSIASYFGSENPHFQPAPQPAWNHFNNDASTEAVYGRIYNWVAANDARGICPTDWRLPTIEDWTTLVNGFGGPDAASPALRDTVHWADYINEFPGGNASGFSARPLGWRDSFWYPGVVDLEPDNYHAHGFRDFGGRVYFALAMGPNGFPTAAMVNSSNSWARPSSDPYTNPGTAIRCLLPR